MKNNKLTLVIAAILIAVAAFFIFKKFQPDAESKKIRIAFVVPTLDNPFFVDMTNGAKGKANEIENIEVIVHATQKADDAIGQNQIVENLITQKVDAICIVPINSESILTVVKKANAANIPIINIDNKINMEMADKERIKIASYVGSDNFDGGVLAGKFIIEKLGGKGNVAILEGVSGNDAAIKRKAGFLEAIKSYPEIKVVASQVANWSREQAFKLFQNILQANPNLNAVFACNDEMALGAYSALEQSGVSKDRIIIVGFDAVKEAIDAVNTGKINATVAQQPKLMGEQGLNLAVEIIKGNEVKETNSTELKIINN